MQVAIDKIVILGRSPTRTSSGLRDLTAGATLRTQVLLRVIPTTSRRSAPYRRAASRFQVSSKPDVDCSGVIARLVPWPAVAARVGRFGVTGLVDQGVGAVFS